MLLKRIMALLGAVVLFIAGFIIYSDVLHSQMEERFRAEREKYHVDNLVLTASDPDAQVRPLSIPAAGTDSNALIGPVPPATTDNNAAAPAASATPAPSSPDTNAAPPAPANTDTIAAPPPPPPDTNLPATPIPSSSMNYPRGNVSPFFQLASYRPSDAGAMEMANPMVSVVTNSPAPAETSTEPTPSAAPKALPAVTPAEPHTGNAGEGSVIVLLYHQFKAAGVKIPAMYQWTMNVDVFESEMKYIHDNGYNVISMADLLKFLHHQGTVPPRAVCITIDDGYKSAIVYAAPILKKYGYPWTFFIYPDFITVGEGPGAASWNDLLELQKEGIDIESHSMTHPNLKLHHQKVKGVWHNFTDQEYAEWLNNETAGSKALLEQHMGKTITCFAYPYGEYNTQVENAAIAAGYDAIFTVADNPVHSTTSLHSIGRYTITQGVEKNFAAYLRQGALGLSDADPAPGATTSNPRPVISATLGYQGTLDPKSIETSVRDFGDVRHDFDPQTNTIRLYLPRDLIQPVVLVNIRVKDAQTGQVMVANWHFNYEPDAAAAAAAHTPIAPPEKATVSTPPPTNAPVTPRAQPVQSSATESAPPAQPATPAASPKTD